jgi:hypothetical protein
LGHLKKHTFIDEQNTLTTTDGELLRVTENINTPKLTFFVTGDSTATIEFKAESIDGDFYLINCDKIGSTTSASSTSYTGTPEAYQVDLTGFDGFETMVTTISAITTDLTIKGVVNGLIGR